MTTAIQTSPSQDPLTGRFAPADARWTVTEVHLPNGKIGYRVGSSGRIYANREHAVNHALCRRPKTVLTRSKVRFDSAKVGKASRTRLETFGRGLEPEATQTQAEPSETTTEAPESPVCETCSPSAVKSRDLEDRRRRVQQRIADREARVREAHRHAFGGEGTKAEREIAWPFFRFWDRRRRWVLRAYNRVVAHRRYASPNYDPKTGGWYEGD
jgi:hypothetical protein